MLIFWKDADAVGGVGGDRRRVRVGTKAMKRRSRHKLLTPDELEVLITSLKEQGRADKFYWLYDWKIVSAAVIRNCHGECLRCKSRGKLKSAKQVHHHFPMRQYPRWALSEFVTLADGTTVRNLYPLCEQCHEEVEAERKRESKSNHKWKSREKKSDGLFINDEKW